MSGEENQTLEMEEILKLNGDCLVDIFSRTCPQDVCNVCLVSKGLNKALEMDAIWEKLLPSDYKEMVPASILNNFPSKMKLYVWLCTNPVILPGQNKWWSLDKHTGKRCLTIGTKDMSIYESFNLFTLGYYAVYSLHIICTVDTRVLSEKVSYTVYLIIKISTGLLGRPNQPAVSMVKFVKEDGVRSRRIICSNLDFLTDDQKATEWQPNAPNPTQRFFGPDAFTDPFRYVMAKERKDGWLAFEIGEFYNAGDDGDVEIFVHEPPCSGDSKRNITIKCIEMRPSK